jgi:hypothetical protein
VRDAACCFLVLASLAGTASADPAPVDPYPDVEPTPLDAKPAIQVEIDATSGVGPVIAMPAATVNGVPVEGAAAAGIPQATAKVEAPAITTNLTSKSSDQLEDAEWYEQQEVQLGGGIGAGLLLLGLVIRGRRAARRRRLALEQRRTQFGMSAVDPSLAKLNVAAWEAGPAVMPIAIEPAMMNRRAQSAPLVQPEPSFVVERASGPIAQRAPSAPIVPHPASALVPQSFAPVPPASQPYRHYSEADRAAYGLHPSQPALVEPLAAPRKSDPKMVMMPHLMQPPGLPAAHVPLPPLPSAVTPTPAAPARGSWHPTVMPWDQATPAQAAQQPAPHTHAPQRSRPPHAVAHAPYAVAPLPSATLPRGAQLPPAHHARAFSPAPAIAPDNVRLMRLAEGTPHPPYAPQPFTSLPVPPARPLPGLPAARTQLQSFVLENSTSALPVDPAPYPLTFPAFPEAAGATMLAPVEPSGLNYWGPQPTEIEVQDDQILCARGSQPAESFRRTMPLASPSDETRIAPPPRRR